MWYIVDGGQIAFSRNYSEKVLDFRGKMWYIVMDFELRLFYVFRVIKIRRYGNYNEKIS